MTKKAEGSIKKAERAAAKDQLATLKGKVISTMNKKEVDTLLTIICVHLGIADAHGVIK